MTKFNHYHWPTKLKKFGIEDSFLKILATKYEKEIPWQVEVRDSDSLIHFVKNVMLPKFLEKLELPHSKTDKNHFYISSHDVSLESTLNAEINRNNDEIHAIELIRKTDGDIKATDALVTLINKTKYLAFQTWIELLEKEYPDDPVFSYLLIRPLFDLSGKGVRRAITEPSLNVIEWLYRRITHGRLLPDDNIAKHYYLKLGLGTEAAKGNGWQFIPAGVENAVQLSAASAGSGWCIAQRGYANAYLSYFDFYILRLNFKPVVALRVSEYGQEILECQGRFNSNPINFVNEILLFIQTQPFDYRIKELQAYQVNFEEQPKAWWKHQLSLWPFATSLAPATIKEELLPEALAGVYHYSHFKHFHRLASRIGLSLDQEHWKLIIEDNPSRYANCPTAMQVIPGIQEACLNGWLSRVSNDQITVEEIQLLPDFVGTNENFQQALKTNFPSSLRYRIRKHPKTYQERMRRFEIQQVLPATAGESADLVLERMIQVLLINEDGVYSDTKFADEHRQREDFSVLREQAWSEAVQAHPPLWFAVPTDLKEGERFQLNEQVPSNVSLDEWCLKVQAKPWILTQQKGVPKSLRFHPQILNAYREGWLPFLIKSPWRIWVQKASRRVYMSYALLEDDQVIAALAEGWLKMEKKILTNWFSKPSDRMKNIPAVQVSALRAIFHPKMIYKLAGQHLNTIKICRDIDARRKKLWKIKWSGSRVNEEIKSLLAIKGIR
jgi:hypothetical protein